MNKLWVAAPAVIAAPLVLAVCVSAASTPSPALVLSRNAAFTPKFALPSRVTVSSVTPTWATVRFVLPSADRVATSEQVVVYPASNQGATTAFSATVAGSPVTITGLKPSTGYYAEVSVNAVRGHAASAWTESSEFVTGEASVTPTPTDSPTVATSIPAPTPTATSISWPTTFDPSSWPTNAAPIPWPTTGTPTPWPTTATPTPTPTSAMSTATPTPTAATSTATPTPVPPFPTSTSTPSATSTSTPSPTAVVPYAPALSSYNTLAQSYSATDIINDGWAQDANDTNEGGGTCPVANATYSSALDAVVLTTAGQPTTATSTDCAHIRSQFTVPTSGDVVEAEVWLPSLSSAATVNGTSYPAGTLLDWASMWTDGANSTNGTENWPADTEIDAVETQYGANYVSVHSGSVSASGGSTGDWTTEQQGWEPAGAIYATPNPGVPNVQPGWNVVDIEFTSTDANIYLDRKSVV